ncbi:MAG: hypothetical protein LBH32_00775, partial [Dysgonamonadaceae bacterium]|nr:hypothetical protein [Dysgonamonadaceae bacterium]
MKIQLQKYNHPILFYSAAVFIPWLCWFIWAWLSHSTWQGNLAVIFLGSVLGLTGLCAPFVIAMILILPDREMRRELSFATFNLRG